MKWRDKSGKEIKRNEKCPCGSGKKFKKCCFLKIVSPLCQKCSCGSGKLLKDCCYIVKKLFVKCKKCSGEAEFILRGDGSEIFRCKNKICLIKKDTRDIIKSKLEIKNAKI